MIATPLKKRQRRPSIYSCTTNQFSIENYDCSETALNFDDMGCEEEIVYFSKIKKVSDFKQFMHVKENADSSTIDTDYSSSSGEMLKVDSQVIDLLGISDSGNKCVRIDRNMVESLYRRLNKKPQQSSNASKMTPNSQAQAVFYLIEIDDSKSQGKLSIEDM